MWLGKGIRVGRKVWNNDVYTDALWRRLAIMEREKTEGEPIAWFKEQEISLVPKVRNCFVLTVSARQKLLKPNMVELWFNLPFSERALGYRHVCERVKVNALVDQVVELLLEFEVDPETRLLLMNKIPCRVYLPDCSSGFRRIV